MEGLVAEYIRKGQVTYDWFEGHHTKFTQGFTSRLERFRKTAQGYAYNTCLAKYGSRHTFVGFIDIDEFIVLRDPDAFSINAVLRDYGEYGGVGFHWRTLGSSGHERRPDGPVVAAYTSCLPRSHHVHRQIKSFVNTRFKPIMISPHRAEFGVGAETLSWDAEEQGEEDADGDDRGGGPRRPLRGSRRVDAEGGGDGDGEGGGEAALQSSSGAYLVDEQYNMLRPGLKQNRATWRRDPTDGLRAVPKAWAEKVASSRVAVYHYVTKSRQDYRVKAARGGGAGISRTMEYFDKINGIANETCLGAIQTKRRFCEPEARG